MTRHLTYIPFKLLSNASHANLMLHNVIVIFDAFKTFMSIFDASKMTNLKLKKVEKTVELLGRFFHVLCLYYNIIFFCKCCITNSDSLMQVHLYLRHLKNEQ